MLTSPTWPEGRGGGSGGDGQGEASKVAFGSQAWVAERIAEPPAGGGRDRGGRGGRGRAERGGCRSRRGARPVGSVPSAPGTRGGAGVRAGAKERRGCRRGGRPCCGRGGKRGMMVGSTSASVLDQSKGVNK